MGFSVLQFKLFFKSVFPVFVFKNFGFSVLMFIAVCGFYVFRDLVFDIFDSRLVLRHSLSLHQGCL